MSTPSGAESTGLQAADDINGFTYIMSNFQHAADWELKKAADGKVTGGLHVKVYETLDPIIRANYADARGKPGGAVGYLTGLPAGSCSSVARRPPPPPHATPRGWGPRATPGRGPAT